MTSRWGLVLALAGALSMVATGCDDKGGGACSLDFESNFNSEFGDPELDAFFEASGKLSVTSKEMETEVREACNDISMRLGGETSDDTATACRNAQAEMKTVLEANAEVTIAITYTPAVCEVAASAVVDCAAECDVNFDADVTPVTCEGGELTVMCEGSCMGSCTVDVNAACSGSCEGECTAMVEATCAGTCNGTCEGECAVMNSDGSCAGACEGTCMGMCDGTISGTCMGSCMGSCEVSGMASCEGSCKGGCEGEYTPLTCEGGELNVEASAECQASCEADASLEIECTDPELVVEASATGSENLTAFIDAMEANLPRLFAVGAKAEIVLDATGTIVATAGDAADAAVSAGAEAVACGVESVALVAQASVSINVSVSATASVTSCSGDATKCNMPM